jgi:hypothetical protein
MTQIRFIASSSADSFYMAAALSAGAEAVPDQQAAAVRPAADDLIRTIGALGLEPEAFFTHVIPQAAGIENNKQLSEVVLRKIGAARGDASGKAARLAAAIADLENAFRGAFPSAADELVQRTRPLQEQWEARGPGLLRKIGELTDASLLPERADVLLVHPAWGGGGQAFLKYNAVAVEAVLANPHPQLPEVARLAWLVSQLQLDVPAVSEMVTPGRLPYVAALALLPATLEAGRYVELLPQTVDPVAEAAEAVRVWGGAGLFAGGGRTLSGHIARTNPSVPCEGDATTADDGHPPPPNTSALARTVLGWWRVYCGSRPPFAVALAALDRMLAEPTPAEQA